MKGTIETSRDILWCDVGNNVEGDNNATTLTLTIDKLYNGIDLSDFLFTMRFSNRDIVLNKKVEEDKIYLSLNIDKMMSDKPGLKPFYISMVKGETIIYSKMSKVYFNKKGFENAPEYEEDILEDYLNQIREMIRRHQEEMEEQLNTIDDKINEEIEEAIDKLLKEIKEETTQAVEEALEDIKENVDKIVEESLERVLDTKLEPIINKLEEVSNEVIELKEDVDGLVLRVVELEEVAGKVNEELLQHQTCLDELKENLTLTDETLSKLKETVSQNKTEVDTKLDNINKTIANDKEELKGLIKALETLHSKDKNELDKRINQNGEDIQALNNRLAFMIKDIADNKVKIDDLNLEVEELTSDIKEIKIKHEEDITKLQTDIEANKEIIEALKLDVEKFEAKVEVIEESIKTMQDDIEDLKVNGGGGEDYMKTEEIYYTSNERDNFNSNSFIATKDLLYEEYPIVKELEKSGELVFSDRPEGSFYFMEDKYGLFIQESSRYEIILYNIKDIDGDAKVYIRRISQDRAGESLSMDLLANHKDKPFLYFVDNIVMEEWGEGYDPMVEGTLEVLKISKKNIEDELFRVILKDSTIDDEIINEVFGEPDDGYRNEQILMSSDRSVFTSYYQHIVEDGVILFYDNPKYSNSIIMQKINDDGTILEPKRLEVDSDIYDIERVINSGREGWYLPILANGQLIIQDDKVIIMYGKHNIVKEQGSTSSATKYADHYIITYYTYNLDGELISKKDSKPIILGSKDYYSSVPDVVLNVESTQTSYSKNIESGNYQLITLSGITGFPYIVTIIDYRFNNTDEGLELEILNIYNNANKGYFEREKEEKLFRDNIFTRTSEMAMHLIRNHWALNNYIISNYQYTELNNSIDDKIRHIKVEPSGLELVESDIEAFSERVRSFPIVPVLTNNKAVQTQLIGDIRTMKPGAQSFKIIIEKEYVFKRRGE